MAYTPINWQTGDTITADKLNKMDPGWEVQETQLLSETVTTVDDDGINVSYLTSTAYIDYDTITVTFNGVDYECSNISEDVYTCQYGAPWSDSLEGYDFSVFPFNLLSDGYEHTNVLITATAGTYDMTVRAQSLEVSDGFRTAVDEVSNNLLPLNVVIGSTTWQEVKDALDAGRVVRHQTGTNVDYVTSIQEFTISCIETSGTNVIVRTFFAADANSPFYAD